MSVLIVVFFSTSFFIYNFFWCSRHFPTDFPPFHLSTVSVINNNYSLFFADVMRLWTHGVDPHHATTLSNPGPLLSFPTCFALKAPLRCLPVQFPEGQDHHHVHQSASVLASGRLCLRDARRLCGRGAYAECFATSPPPPPFSVRPSIHSTIHPSIPDLCPARCPCPVPFICRVNSWTGAEGYHWQAV